jgi:hypothetical protein
MGHSAALCKQAQLLSSSPRLQVSRAKLPAANAVGLACYYTVGLVVGYYYTVGLLHCWASCWVSAAAACLVYPWGERQRLQGAVCVWAVTPIASSAWRPSLPPKPIQVLLLPGQSFQGGLPLSYCYWLIHCPSSGFPGAAAGRQAGTHPATLKRAFDACARSLAPSATWPEPDLIAWRISCVCCAAGIEGAGERRERSLLPGPVPAPRQRAP